MKTSRTGSGSRNSGGIGTVCERLLQPTRAIGREVRGDRVMRQVCGSARQLARHVSLSDIASYASAGLWMARCPAATPTARMVSSFRKGAKTRASPNRASGSSRVGRTPHPKNLNLNGLEGAFCETQCRVRDVAPATLSGH